MAAGSLALACLLAVAGIGCNGNAGTGGDSGAGHNDSSQLVPPNSFLASWTQDISSRYGAPDQIFLRDDLVLVYTSRNVVYAISATGGRTLWVSQDVVGPLDRLWPPVLVDALGRMGADVERILAFPTSTSYVVLTDGGRRVQETPLERGERALTSPSFSYEGQVYAGLADDYGGRAARIDPTRLVNPVQLPRLLRGVVIGRPVVYNDVFYIADETGAVYAITQDGDQAWTMPSFQTGGAVHASLTADEDGLYVPSTDSTLYVLDRVTGRLKWRYFAEVTLGRPAFPTREHVFLPVEGQGVVALSKTEGDTISREPLWRAEGARDVLSHDEQNVYLLHEDGRIVAHRKTDGKAIFRTHRTDLRKFARNPGGPRIYAATPGGQIVAIEPVLTRGQVGQMVMSDVPAGPGAPETPPIR